MMKIQVHYLVGSGYQAFVFLKEDKLDLGIYGNGDTPYKARRKLKGAIRKVIKGLGKLLDK